MGRRATSDSGKAGPAKSSRVKKQVAPEIPPVCSQTLSLALTTGVATPAAMFACQHLKGHEGPHGIRFVASDGVQGAVTWIKATNSRRSPRRKGER